MKNDLIELAEACGYVLIESKNRYMISFKKEENPEWRINVYYTTMTVQVQNFRSSQMGIYKDVDLKEFENILNKYAKAL